jgi:type II secretory pathway predicted ATPase ExeA/cell division septation protein DedD
MDPKICTPDELAAYLVRQCSLDGRRAESSVTLLQYFGFQEEPFRTTPDPRCLYLSRTHREALTALERGFSSGRGFTAMIAPPGMGKTTLLFRFLEDIRQTTRTVFLFDVDAQCKPRDFIAYILRDIGITPGQSSSETHKQLSAALVRENRAGRKFVVVIDEAQNLSDAVLERVRLLANFETSQGKLMHIVLSGQPQLADKLIQPSQVQLLQRITTICRIEPLSAEETVGYIDYRLRIPGYDGEPLFTEGALNLITEASHGTPRTINNLCYDALSACYALKSKQIDGSIAAKVIADLQLAPQSREPIAAAVNVAAEQPIERKQLKRANQLRRRLVPATAARVMLWVPVAAALLVMCVLGVLRLTEVRVPQTGDDRSLNLKVLPASVPAPIVANTRKTIATKPTPNTTPVEPRFAVGHHVSAPASAAAVTPPQASAAAQPPSPGVGANAATTQQSPAPAGQSGSPAGAPMSAAAQERTALAGNAPEDAQAAAAPNVPPALPAVPLMVQIAAVSNPEDASVLTSALRKRGYAVTALRGPADNLIHVAIGPFYSRDEANRWRVMLLNDGYTAIIKP